MNPCTETLAFKREVERMAELFDQQTFLRSGDLVNFFISLHVVERGMQRRAAGYTDEEVGVYIGDLERYYREQYAALRAQEAR